MSVLSVILIFQLQSQQAAVKESPSSSGFSAILPGHVWAVLLPVSTVLSALSLTLNLSSVVVCLLHGYFSTEVCRGDQDTERADWFLLDSRAVRHVAVGLFCLGVAVYLAAMSIFMLLIFEVETGIASACVLSSGILILLVVVIHSLLSITIGHVLQLMHVLNVLYTCAKNSPKTQIRLAYFTSLKAAGAKFRGKKCQNLKMHTFLLLSPFNPTLDINTCIHDLKV
uniref:Si:ch211-125m10.6 n=1 Tax=Sphaeramia orbicularis TaxID=375764 RepID=A0A672YYI5_9TELE